MIGVVETVVSEVEGLLLEAQERVLEIGEIDQDRICMMLSVMNASRLAKCLFDLPAISQFIAEIVLINKEEDKKEEAEEILAEAESQDSLRDTRVEAPAQTTESKNN